ncbi:MAG: hypothetical protein B6I24_02665 [Bacteroidetes bacterium 4572_128]|nr:MAG: hypothetical protein B6I24_02665 [Bacteroidetes bacterium 4572_128]
MKSIKIKNLRCIKDTSEIPLKNLTVLLGQNSSGKSTFLRLFPLLKQSVETRTSGPILWFDDYYADFGDFNSAVRKNEKEISFQFELKILKTQATEVNLIEDTVFIINLFMKSSNENKTYISKLNISFFDQKIEISFNHEKILTEFLINEKNLTKKLGIRKGVLKTGILPHLIFISKNNLFSKDELSIHNELYNFLKKKLRTNTSDNTINKIINNLGLGSDETFLKKLISNASYLKTWKNELKNWDFINQDFKNFKNLTIANSFFALLRMLDNYLISSISNFYYMKPIRAVAKRSYRRQDLAVSEVDPKGANLAMFIDNLSQKKKKEFQNWIKNTFDFYPHIKRSGIHVELRLIDVKTGNDFNIADRGFGFSQILPIITQLWSVIYKNRKQKQQYNIPIILAIEQPELHLHPALQSQLIDCFIETIKLARKKGIELKLIIETHSQTIVNRIGHRIANKNLSEKDVSVVLFEFNENKEYSSVRLSNYNKQGFLEKWPFGFFNPKEI